MLGMTKRKGPRFYREWLLDRGVCHHVGWAQDYSGSETTFHKTVALPSSSREVVTLLFVFEQTGLLIDVPTAPTTALALGNGPLLSATFSFLSSRA
jgi:hypothetical protein